MNNHHLAAVPAPAGATAVSEWRDLDDNPARLFEIARSGTARAVGLQTADGGIDDEPVTIAIAADGQLLSIDIAAARALMLDLGKTLRAVDAFDAQITDQLRGAWGA